MRSFVSRYQIVRQSRPDLPFLVRYQDKSDVAIIIKKQGVDFVDTPLEFMALSKHAQQRFGTRVTSIEKGWTAS